MREQQAPNRPLKRRPTRNEVASQGRNTADDTARPKSSDSCPPSSPNSVSLTNGLPPSARSTRFARSGPFDSRRLCYPNSIPAQNGCAKRSHEPFDWLRTLRGLRPSRMACLQQKKSIGAKAGLIFWQIKSPHAPALADDAFVLTGITERPPARPLRFIIAG